MGKRVPREDRKSLNPDELLERWDRDWKKFRQQMASKDAELKEMEVLYKEAIANGTDTFWDRFHSLAGKTQNGVMLFLVTIYAWWNAAGYPAPGEKFWGAESVNTLLYWFLTTVFVLTMIRPYMTWLILGLVGCMLFAYLFGG